MLDDEVEEIDVDKPQAGSLFGKVIPQKHEVLSDAQLGFRWVVEDVEGDLVAEALPLEEVIRGDSRQNLIQSVGQRIAHGRTLIQCKT
jgi:hypothetical protein